jgi:hypothetical protein
MDLLYETEDRGSLIGLMSNPLPVLFHITVVAQPLRQGKKDDAAPARERVEGRLAKSDGTLITGLQAGQRFTLRSNQGRNLDIETTDAEGGFVLLASLPAGFAKQPNVHAAVGTTG